MSQQTLSDEPQIAELCFDQAGQRGEEAGEPNMHQFHNVPLSKSPSPRSERAVGKNSMRDVVARAMPGFSLLSLNRSKYHIGKKHTSYPRMRQRTLKKQRQTYQR